MATTFQPHTNLQGAMMTTTPGMVTRNSSQTADGFGWHLFTAALAAMVLFLVVFVVPAAADPGNDSRAPDLGDCQNLQAPAGNTAAYQVYAEGVQIYRWNGTNWSFVAPRAVLLSNSEAEAVIGTHYAGPTWESLSGSKVVGTVLERCTPDAGAVPWLLLKAVSSEGPGIFAGVTFIQRVNTVGGIAPADPGNAVGEVVEVPYTTEYLFYRAHP